MVYVALLLPVVYAGYRLFRTSGIFFSRAHAAMALLSLVPAVLLLMPHGGAWGVVTAMVATWCLTDRRKAIEPPLDATFQNLVQSVADELRANERTSPWLAIVIPAYHEAENIPSVLRDIQALELPYDIVPLVVDDGSTDSTTWVAKDNGAAVAQLPHNCGGGFALRIGLEIAALAGASWTLTMDADGQHQPCDIPKMLQHREDTQCDMVVGSRNLGGQEGQTLLRAVGITWLSRLVSCFTGTKVTDCSNGMRLFNQRALQYLERHEDRHHTAEALLFAHGLGLNVQEVGIQVKPRLSGESKKGRDIIYGGRFILTIVRSWWRVSAKPGQAHL